MLIAEQASLVASVLDHCPGVAENLELLVEEQLGIRAQFAELATAFA
ncbi:hypothetical protein GCM10009692_27670 [Leucobacter aridicollis]